MNPPRDGTTCVGFRQLTCSSCRANAGLDIPTSEAPQFRTSEVALLAMRDLKQQNPDLYAQIFAPGRGCAWGADARLLATGYQKILGGASVRLQREQYEETQDERGTFRDLWRSYVDHVRNAYRKACGLPAIGDGWVREMQMLMIVRSIFPGEEVVHNCFPHWLRPLQLDAYLPCRNLALEHMGEQHYRPIEFFGGEEAFESVVRRDQRKRTICQNRGVRVVDVRYDEPLTRENIQRLIDEAAAIGA